MEVLEEVEVEEVVEAKTKPRRKTKPDRVLTPAEHGNTVAKLMEHISNHSHHRPDEVFRDFLTLSMCIIERIEVCKRNELDVDKAGYIPAQWLIWLEPAFEAVENECLAVQKRYDSEGCTLFSEAFAHLCMAARVFFCADYDYTDVLGQLYEEIAVSKSGQQWFGQFFTPAVVANMMATLTMPGDGIEQIVRSRVHQAAQSLGLDEGADDAEVLWARYVVPLQECVEPVTVCDPACGSGRLLLAAASETPRWMLSAGLVLLLGVDLDPVCVQMTKINLWLREVPSQVFHGNSLENAICRKDASGELALVEMDVFLANPPFGKKHGWL